MRVSPPKSSELHFAPPSLNLFQPYETVEILEWVALLWILALAKARSAAPISAVISAKRATPASAKVNATIAAARQKGSWRRCSVVAARSGDASPSAPCHPPFCLYARRTPVFQQSPSAGSFCFVAAQDQRCNLVIESRHVNQIDQEHQELGSDQPDVARALEEIIRPVTDGERAGKIEEEKARDQQPDIEQLVLPGSLIERALGFGRRFPQSGPD